MSECYEATMSGHLADLLIPNLRRAAAAAGFDEVLHIPNPDVTEFRRGQEVLSLTNEDAGRNQRRLVLESKTTDVEAIVGEAARLVMLEVALELLVAMPWVDRVQLERDLDVVLRGGLAKTRPPAA